MKTYQEALQEVIASVHVLEVEERPLLGCVGQAVAEDVVARRSLPPLDLAGPDGYAVRSADIAGASAEHPVTLRVVGTTRAGFISKHVLSEGTAVRIMTGSPLPAGADCVVRFEDTDEPGDKNGPSPRPCPEVKVFVAGGPGANVRPAGGIVREGTLVLPRGTGIGPAQIAVLGTLGIARVRVARRPTVAIISTGDELVGLGRPIAPGKSYDSNSGALAALVAHYGAVPKRLGIARDTEASLTTKIKKAMSADAIITSGGVSKGDYDLVRLVAGKLGKVVFSRINMGPGASFAFGLLDRPAGAGDERTVPLFALSGPTVGCLNNLELLVRPALLKMMGFTDLAHPVVEAVAADAVLDKNPMDTVKWTYLDITGGAGISARPGPAGRSGYSDGRAVVTMNATAEHGPLVTMALADSLVIVPAGREIAPGDKMDVLPLDWRRA